MASCKFQLAVTAVTKYNGIYKKQASLVNGKDWWKHLYNQPGHLDEAEGGTSIYWSDTAERWVIEAPDVIWEAPTLITHQPTEEPTQQPTLAPTELCTAIFVPAVVLTFSCQEIR